MTIKEYLKLMGISQKDFAYHIGLRTASLSHYISRNASPCLETAIMIHYASGKRIAFEDMVRTKPGKKPKTGRK